MSDIDQLEGAPFLEDLEDAGEFEDLGERAGVGLGTGAPEDLFDAWDGFDGVEQLAGSDPFDEWADGDLLDEETLQGGHHGGSWDSFDLEDYTEGEVEPEVVGADTRKLVSNTRAVPFRFICHLSMGCTGTLVAPTKVLTSAHCVYDRTAKRYTWSGHSATPGRKGAGSSRSAAPYGSARIVRADIPAAYRTAATYDAAWPHDYAVLTLGATLSVPGSAFSRLGVIAPATLLKVKVNTAGYPGHGSRRQLWTYNAIRSLAGARMRHVLDTKPGQSGSPIWLRWQNVRTIVGIHKSGFTGSPQQNRGVALTAANLAVIRGWLKK